MATAKEKAQNSMQAISELAQTDELKDIMSRAITNITDGIEPLLVNEVIRNDFIDTINKIAYVAVNRRTFQNPLAFLIGDRVEMGDSVEEMHIDVMEAAEFEVSSAAMAKLLTSMPPSTMSALHRVNRDVVYAVDISNSLIRRAFTTYANFNSMMEQIVRELYNKMYINQYKWTKGILGAAILNKHVTMVPNMSLPTDAETSKAFLKKASSYAKLFPFPSTSYNAAGKEQFTQNGDVYLFLSAEASANVDIDALMYAYNPDRASIMGKSVILDEIPDPTYGVFAVLCDKEFIRINPQIVESGNFFNAYTFSTKHTIHSAEIYSYSPFRNCVAFGTGTGYTKQTFNGSIA